MDAKSFFHNLGVSFGRHELPRRSSLKGLSTLTRLAQAVMMFLSGSSYLADVNHTLGDVLERSVVESAAQGTRSCRLETRRWRTKPVMRKVSAIGIGPRTVHWNNRLSFGAKHN